MINIFFYQYRQYALLLSYFQYCQHVLDPDVPRRILQLLLGTEQDSEDMDLEKVPFDYYTSHVFGAGLYEHESVNMFNGEFLNVLLIFQIDKEQAELARSNFSILRKEGQAILDLVGPSFPHFLYKLY